LELEGVEAGEVFGDAGREVGAEREFIEDDGGDGAVGGVMAAEGFADCRGVLENRDDGVGVEQEFHSKRVSRSGRS